MVDWNRLTSEIRESDAFILPNGSKIKSLTELLNALATMDDAFFKEHVNESKNDFANWIQHCFGDELLAQRISKLNTKQSISDELRVRLEQARISLQMKNSSAQEIKPQPTSAKTQVSQQISETPIELDANLDLDSDLGIEPNEPVKTIVTPQEEKTQEPSSSEQLLDISLDDSLDTNLDSSLDTPLDSSLDNIAPVETIKTTPTEIKPELKTPELLETPRIEVAPTNPVSDVKTDLTEIKTKLEPVQAGVELPHLQEQKPDLAESETIQTAQTITIEQATAEPKIVEPAKTEAPKLAEIHSEYANTEHELQVKSETTTQVNTDSNSVSLTDEEKRILATDNKVLKPAELFKKFKLQKKVAETNIISDTPANLQTTISSNLPSDLTEEERILLQTDDKKLAFKELFKKLKLQKEHHITPAKQTLETKTPESIKPVEEIKEKAIDLLNLSEDEFNKLIGVNTSEEYVATLSKAHIVKTKQRKFLKTGVPGFDELVERGIPEGSAILVSGGPGSGKTTFCIQQLGWAAEHGEKCLFISLEEEEDKLIEHMKDYGLNPENYLRNGNLRVKKLDSFKLSRAVEALLAHARGELMIDIGPVLDIIPEGFKPDRVVLDSLSSIAAAFAGRAEEYRIYVEQLFNIFGRIGATSFIITEIQGSETSGHGGTEDFLADGVVNFYNIKKGNQRQSAMEVFKMRGVGHKKKVVPFNFISGKGIEIYPLEEVFNGY